MRKIRGGCFCGAVRYEARGAPSNSMICHCRTCRGVAGALAVPWVTFEREGFRFTRGRPKAFKSSRPVRRTFCGGCGTPLTYATAKWPRTIDITTCTLDRPERFAPTHRSWVSHDVGWMRSSDKLRKFPKSRPG